MTVCGCGLDYMLVPINHQCRRPIVEVRAQPRMPTLAQERDSGVVRNILSDEPVSLISIFMKAKPRRQRLTISSVERILRESDWAEQDVGGWRLSA